MEGGGGFQPNSEFGNFSDVAMDLDFMDELLFEGCWLETSEAFNMQPGPSAASGLNDPSQCLPISGSNTASFSINSHHQMPEGETEKKVSVLPYSQIEDFSKSQPQNWAAAGTAAPPGSFIVEDTEVGSRWWIAPGTGPASASASSVKERLMQAIGYLKECTKERDVLIQIWVPVKREGKHVLTTEGQPYYLNTNCKSLEIFRDVSKSYNFPAEEDSKDLVGLPGRVYLGKLPEWTPDVRFFRSDEYPRIRFAQRYNVGGSLALPVFERGSGTCLGVVEIVSTSQKINYRPELEHVRKALEAVDLRSSNNFSPPNVKAYGELYLAALPEIAEVLRSACKTYKLPLALTWAPCVNQGKSGCRHSDENIYHCVSTVDSACFVAEQDFQDFLEACSEHHLFRGQGIVGRAFTTNKQCFVTDITAFSKTNYPLSHHARMFGLRGAIAVPLQSIFTGSIEFVLELFLPKDCLDCKAQKQMLNSLSSFMQQACQSLHVVVDKELEEEVILPVKEMVVSFDGRSDKEETQFGTSSKENSPEESSWIAHMMEAQEKGKGVSVSWEYQNEEPKEEFKMTTHWEDTQLGLYNKQVLSDFGQLHQNAGTKNSVKGGGGDSSSSGGNQKVAGKRAAEKRRTKVEKTISLQVLRQHFAGSLKDAAKSIGVCPTTLKRICRQHGITRWPSRKIKKVGHSLRKLQLVIDSVQGAEGAIQVGSFYSSFPELSSPNFSGSGPSSSLKISDHSKALEPQHESGVFSQRAAAPKSPSSSCSRGSGSSTCCSTGAKQHSTSINVLASADGLPVEDPGGALKRALSDADLHALNQEEPKLLARSHSHKTFGEYPRFETLLPPMTKSSGQYLRAGSTMRVKATFGDVKIRFSLQPSWEFRDLQQEIAKRFNIEDVSRFDLKYLDDDQDWVLLTCDADLEECIDIYKSSQSHTIKISIHQPSQPNLGSSFGSSAPSLYQDQFPTPY